MRQARYRFFLGCLCVLALCIPLSMRAQENAELSGTVKDPTGAVVPNATITLINTATGDVRTSTSNGAGLYDFSALRIGTYTLKVEAQGFSKYEKTGIVMNVAATVQENAVLVIGGSNQTVTVEADALHLQTETNEVSNLITGEQITQLATNGRNMVSLTTLGTGVSNNISSFNGVTAQGSGFGLSFNGMRPDHNNWLIDGGEAYDRGSGGKFDLMPTMDALAEFQTLSSNYSPDYGISSGGTVTMALKSGTKQFHGGLWEFNRNDAFDAGYYFSKQNNQATPELRLNIYGGDIGGPVFIPGLYPKSKSKTFFFWSEEWRKFIQGANPTAANTIPASDFPTAGQDLAYTVWTGTNGAPNLPIVPVTTDPAKTALYTQLGLVAGQPFPTNCTTSIPCTSTIPHQLFDPNAVLFLGTGAIPHPNSGTTLNPQNVQSPKQPTNVREDVVRADHDINDKLHLMGHWIHDQMSQTIFPVMWSGDSYDTVGNLFANPSWASVIKLTQTLSPSLLNETSLNVNGNTIAITPTASAGAAFAQPTGWSATGFFSGNNAANRLPQVAFQGGPLTTTWTTNYWPWHNSFLDYQIRDDLSWNKGRHGLKFGFSYMRVDKNQQLQQDTQGDYTFGNSTFAMDSYVNFLLGFANSYTQLQDLTGKHWINNTYSFYGMDNWRVLPRLTMNLGVRYDGMPHVYEKNNQVSNFVPANFSATSAQQPDANGNLNAAGPGFSQPAGAAVPFYLNGVEFAGVNGFPRGLVKNSYMTIQPRVGLAYDLFGTGKTVLRLGGGLFYERVQGNDIYGAATNPPFAFQPTANSVYFSNPRQSALDGSIAPPGPVTKPASLTSLASYYPNPATAQYSFGIQQQLAPAIVGVIQYVGSNGWNQSDQRVINTLPLTDAANTANPYDLRQAVNGGADPNLYRQYLGYGSITQTESATNTSYNSLQAGLRVENKHGLTTQFSYTWSHEIDIQSGDLGSTNIQGGNSTVSNPFDLKYDRGAGVLDRRHIFSVNYDYTLPFFRSGNLLEREVLGGWELSGVTVAQSGAPRNVSFSGDTLGLGGGTANRPNLVGRVSMPKTQQKWFDPSAFAAPTAPWAGGANQGFGSARKDNIVGPGLFNWNMALFKSIPLSAHEGPKIEIRFESFNTFNHTEFNGIDTGLTDSNFGQVTSTYDPRVMQFGGKFIF